MILSRVSPCWALFGGLVLLTFTSLRAEDDSVTPHAWPGTRYEQLKQQAPFALATPVAPPAQVQTGFAASWYVSGIGRLDGQDFVTIKARDLSVEFSLYGHETNAVNGVCLTSVEWSDKIGKSVVIIKRGNDTARLEFNEAEVARIAKVTDVTATNGSANAAQNSATDPSAGHGGIITVAQGAPSSPPAPFPAWMPANGSKLPLGQSRLRSVTIQSPPQ